MQTHTDPRASQTYLTRREQQERALAARSDDAMIRRIHLELADRYAAMARVPQAIAA
ncbi:hypothetical protein [Sphingomonas sp. Leaf17]|uniref:hypothetical protein n=1 Tax=Sphingomonas sp. Leaf17 TaxID=1735683 RepID=UPI000AD3B77B|nr:hypothetical protein [Sphingomonas sp. Leaf17]